VTEPATPSPYRSEQEFVAAVERAAAAPYEHRTKQKLTPEALAAIVDWVRPEFASIKIVMADDLEDLVRRGVKALTQPHAE
jgi:hypothetical protein